MKIFTLIERYPLEMLFLMVVVFLLLITKASIWWFVFMVFALIVGSKWARRKNKNKIIGSPLPNSGRR